MLFNFQGSWLVRSPGRAIYFTIPLAVCQELFSEALRSLFSSLRPAGQLRYIIISHLHLSSPFCAFLKILFLYVRDILFIIYTL